MTTANNLYLITNRQYQAGTFDDCVAPGGDLSYTTYPLGAWQPGDTPPGNATFTVTDQSTLQAAMVADLARLAVDGQVNLMIFIHGFDTTWAQIQQQSGQWLTGLLGPCGHPDAGYRGVQLSFDWPSGQDVLDFIAAMGRAQDTAAHSLPQLKAFIEAVRGDPALSGITVNLQVLCHSMGNYLLQQGACHFPKGYFTQTLLVAAMLENTTFNPGCSSQTPGADISAATGYVNCYYGCNDDVLGFAFLDGWLCELGKDGPYSYSEPLTANFIGLDCSAVVNSTNQVNYGAKQTHTAYFFIPETQMDMAASLLGQTTAFRKQMPNTRQGFVLADKPAGND